MPGQLLPGLARALTWAGEPWNRKRARMPAPTGTLDTLVNGPEGLPPFDGDAWERVDWCHHEEQVRRLRGRIFQAVRDGDWPRARSLQRLMLRSWSNTLVSVRQVTQRNTGRRTAGIDGLVALTSQARAEMAVRVHASIGSHRPSPVRRVYIPKASDKTKMRPLGIPLLTDRCHQARVKHALEPEWEARFEPRSYGFRPGRGCHDAIESLFNTLCGKSARVWILDADLASAFDKISHEHLLGMLGGFPAKGMIAGWLRAGIFEAGKGCAVTPGSRLSRSRRGWPSGWSREGWLSMRPRPGSSPFLRGLIFSDLISAATPTASCLSNRALRPSRGSGNGLPGSSAHSAGPTPKQYWRRSSTSRGDGAPTTRRWCHPGCSVPWMITCGNSLTSGRAGPTRTSRKAGP